MAARGNGASGNGRARRKARGPASGNSRKPRPRARRAAPAPERHELSPTAVAAEALRSGVLPLVARHRDRIPHEDETIRVGDPDDDSLANEYVGEDLPGGSTPTPDQSNVDEIGRVYGIQDEDSGELRTSREMLARRDRRRSELRPPRRPER
jgi:uncharacterized protein DUF6335